MVLASVFKPNKGETRHCWIPSTAMAFVSMRIDFVDPKGQLTHFCQKYCKRPLHHADVEYLTYELGEQYQAIVILNCIKGNVFPGSICSNQRDAEWSAAKQALKAFASLTEMVLLPQVQEAGSIANSTSRKKPVAGRCSVQEGYLQVLRAGVLFQGGCLHLHP